METPSGRALWGTPRRSMARAASVSDRSRSADTRRAGWAAPPDGGSVDDGPVTLVNVAVRESSFHAAATGSRHDVDPGGPQLTSARANCRSALYVLVTSNYINRSDDPVRAAQVGSASRRVLSGARGTGGPCAAVARPTASTPATRAPSTRSAATALWARAPVVMLSSKTRTLWVRSQPGSMPGTSSKPRREA